MSEFLDLVDENDNVIGQEDRAIIHRDGLLHRELNIFFVTPDKRILFQQRVPKPPAYELPMLDATIGGHVDVGETAFDAALREMHEESGLMVPPEDLILLDVMHIYEEFPGFKRKNHVLRSMFLVKFSGDIASLKIEEGKSLGFLPLSLEQIAQPTDEFLERFHFIEFLVSDKMLNLYKKMLSA